MAAIVSNEKLQEAFSLALEQRSAQYADLVSNANVILKVMRENGGWKSYSGPTIRERLLYNETGSYTRYSGYDVIQATPTELVSDAEYTPKMAAIPVVLSGQEILNNAGSNQLMDIMEVHIQAAERELQDRFTEDLHSAGSLTNQIGGLQLAVPTAASSGTYGGISRVNVANWRTGSYDASSDFSITLSGTTIHDAYSNVLNKHTRGKNGPNLIVASIEHFRFFQQSLIAIQRVTKETKTAQLGFPSLAFAGLGYELDVVLEGGIGSAMPASTTYFLKLGEDGLCFRYNPQRNFTAFGGKRVPVNQDAVIQMIGIMGNLTLANPLFQAKLID